jgi:hypothetical protein
LELAPGDEGTLDVRVEDVAQLAGAELHLTFDSAVLEVVDADSSVEGVQIAHGDFLSPDFVVQNIVEPGTGRVDYAIACMPLDKAVSGGGVLARVTFRALAKGETQVAVRSALLADVQEQPISVETGSSVVVVSRPPMAVWISIGLIAVAVLVGFVVVVRNAIKAR